jgi:predicted Zn-dependent protease
VDARIDKAGEDGVVVLSIIRGGQPSQISIRTAPACRTQFELSPSSVYNSEADGEIVKVSLAMMRTFQSEDEAASVIAHELAHNILRHRERLDGVRVNRGVFEAFGRAVGYIRRTEVEADMLSVPLVANAGYDPTAAATYWQRIGRQKFSGVTSLFLARTHPKWTTRVKLFEREAAAVAADPARPHRPALLSTVDQPLTNDWQPLLAGL